jgi:hypothetical protein
VIWIIYEQFYEISKLLLMQYGTIWSMQILEIVWMLVSGPSHTMSSWGFALLVIIGVSLGILIILAIIIGVGFWIYRKLKAHWYTWLYYVLKLSILCENTLNSLSIAALSSLFKRNWNDFVTRSYGQQFHRIFFIIFLVDDRYIVWQSLLVIIP